MTGGRGLLASFICQPWHPDLGTDSSLDASAEDSIDRMGTHQ